MYLLSLFIQRMLQERFQLSKATAEEYVVGYASLK